MLKNKIIIPIFVIFALIFGSVSSTSAASDIWYISLQKSSLNPPGYVFGIVWPILYFLMTISAYRTFENTKILFLFQLFLNSIWSWLFFYFQQPLISLIDIVLLITINIWLLRKMFSIDKLSGYLYAPYLVWLCFASYLNLFIILNN